MRPEQTGKRRVEAAFVQERLDRYLQMQTAQRQQEYEWAERCFTEKYNCRWQDWVTEKKQNSR